MYYVVYLLDPHVNVIVPTKWIYKYNEQVVKFINNGLNQNQKHTIFYTENDNAYNYEKIPLPNYSGCSFLRYADEFPNEGCYIGKLIKFFGNYTDATEYAKFRRVGDPAIYYMKRATEEPIPQHISDTLEESVKDISDLIDFEKSLTSEKNAHDVDEITTVFVNEFNTACVGANASEFAPLKASATSNDEEIISSQSLIEKVQSNVTDTDSEPNPLNLNIEENVGMNAHNTSAALQENIGNVFGSEFDALDSEIEENAYGTTSSTSIQPNGCTSDIDLLNDQHTSVERLIPKIEAVIIVEPKPENTLAVEALIDEEEETVIIDDEIEMTYNIKVGFGKPFHVTNGLLIKRENDILSGNIPFDELKNGNRLYKLGEYILEVPLKIIDVLMKWNSCNVSFEYNQRLDQRFIKALILLCIEIENVTYYDIAEFVRGFIVHRANGDNNRVQLMEQFMSDFISNAGSGFGIN